MELVNIFVHSPLTDPQPDFVGEQRPASSSDHRVVKQRHRLWRFVLGRRREPRHLWDRPERLHRLQRGSGNHTLLVPIEAATCKSASVVTTFICTHSKATVGQQMATLATLDRIGVPDFKNGNSFLHWVRSKRWAHACSASTWRPRTSQCSRCLSTAWSRSRARCWSTPEMPLLTTGATRWGRGDSFFPTQHCNSVPLLPRNAV